MDEGYVYVLQLRQRTVGYGVTANIAASHLMNLQLGIPEFSVAGSSRIAAARGSIPRIRILLGVLTLFLT
jgi:hypothetical protein